MTTRHLFVRSYVAIVVGVVMLAGCGPGVAPAGQARMAVLSDSAALDSLRDDFNNAASQTRVIVLLSPT